MKKLYKNIIVAILFGLAMVDSYATENGVDSAALGAEGFTAGALPPPGVYLLSYYQNYHANKMLDNQGDVSVPDFHVDSNALVTRLVWMTDKKILGGNLGFYAVQPFADLRISVAGMSDSNKGLGDLIFAPLLSWHSGNHHWATSIEGVFPTGDYDAPTIVKPIVANLGKNYYTVRPMFAYSYLGHGLDLSTKVSYSFNTENNDTNYQSGDYLAADYSFGYKVTPSLTFGAQGYVFKQLTDDESNYVDIGNKGQVIGVGPGIHYQPEPNWYLEGKYMKEIEVKNRPEGSATWMKFVWTF
ncbi:transporter [Acinetobacter sichuanensis]|uniref:Phenol degradation protein meta n=1 Tax=Acinetobacter sichuanensis TaxID=2136183 RepID=A0A371YQZ8_9GAMM|nr:transporter [Acinetobacter sichuanensis]RFC83895.1 phenol degradation protein meta [Acinetobacter sichuanensis]